MEINKPYLKTIPGILGIVQVVLNAIVFMCSICSGWCFRGQSFFVWAEFVSSIGFWVSLTLFLFQFITGSRERMIQLVAFWKVVEAGLVALWCFFFFTVFLDCAIKSTQYLRCGIPGTLGIYTSVAYDRGVIGATAFFAFAAIAAYAADLFFRFKEWRSDGGALPWKNNQNTNQQNAGEGPKTVEV